MKNVVFTVVILFTFIVTGCSEETQNRIGRVGVTWLEGDYRVTYADGAFTKTWVVNDGKVTSEPAKGYYFFWAENENGKEYYVQTPIARTFIEEIR